MGTKLLLESLESGCEATLTIPFLGFVPDSASMPMSMITHIKDTCEGRDACTS